MKKNLIINLTPLTPAQAKKNFDKAEKEGMTKATKVGKSETPEEVISKLLKSSWEAKKAALSKEEAVHGMSFEEAVKLKQANFKNAVDTVLNAGKKGKALDIGALAAELETMAIQHVKASGSPKMKKKLEILKKLNKTKADAACGPSKIQGGHKSSW